MGKERISRRALLVRASAIAVGCTTGTLSALAADAAPAPYPDKFAQDGGLVVLPSKGTLYVASDFHTRHTDFQKWLTKTSIVERLKSEEDTYGLILGDAVDIKPGDPLAEKDGDSRIVDRIRQIQTAVGEAGKRFIYIQGNHEREVCRIYGLLKKHFALDARTRARLVAALYASQDGLFYQQFNFLERITDEQYAYLKDLPVAVLSKNGIVGVHAGPSKSAKNRKELAQKAESVVDELVWSRPEEIAEIPGKGYSSDQLAGFLRLMENAGLLISGHTPLSALLPGWLQHGVGVFGERQIILATSYGSAPGEKSYLVMDLARRYNAARDIAPGRELQILEPQVGVSPYAFPSRRVHG